MSGYRNDSHARSAYFTIINTIAQQFNMIAQ
jgi:hypothetical protein